MLEQEIYLNHAGTSWPKPQVVVDAAQTATVRSPHLWDEHFYQAHHGIADFFGIRNPEQLLLTPGCTSSLAVALGDIDLGGRRRVLTSDWEHHAMHRPLLKLGESGVSIEYIPGTGESSLDLNQVEHQLAKGDVGLVAITASANVTGDLLPFEEVIKLAHQYDAQVLLDAAQVVGWFDLDLVALEADFVAFGGHKGLHGLWGIGGLYMSEGARTYRSATSYELSQTEQQSRPGYCDVGSVDQIALAGLHAAIVWLKDIDRRDRLKTAREHINQMEIALRLVGARCYAVQEYSRRMPSLAFSVDGRTSAEITATLKKQGIIVGSGLQCSPHAHQMLGTEGAGLVRISVGLEHNARNIDSAIDTIRDVVITTSA